MGTLELLVSLVSLGAWANTAALNWLARSVWDVLQVGSEADSVIAEWVSIDDGEIPPDFLNVGLVVVLELSNVARGVRFAVRHVDGRSS